MKKDKMIKLTVSAILSSLSVVILYIGCMTPLSYTAVALVSLATVFAVIEFGGKFPFLIYAVTSVLSLLIVHEKSTALFYVLFFGYYPICKAVFERLHYIISWILKASVFNTALLIIITVSVYILHLEDTGLEMRLVVILLGNLTFVLYDIALNKLITLYLVKIRAAFKLKDYFEN